ncbi:DNA-binding protein [Morganella morganii]|nr:DNA-binding protein [Morganella morganii]
MSRRAKALSREMHTLARQAGGSFKTVADRVKIATRVADELAKLNIQIRSVDQLKSRHIESYMNARREQNIGLRTRQNEMSAIRAIFRVAGRHKLADPKHERLSNTALGIAGASRTGTRTAISDERFHGALARIEIHDQGVALTMQLSRYLGLRNEEAVQSAKSLRTWQQALQSGKDRVHVVFGTKGGRPRETLVPDKTKLLPLINKALEYANKHNGRLIDRPSLHSAKDRYINVMRRIGGFVNEESNHGLRYAYAQDVEKYYKSRGYSQKEAYALTSMDLGHGDGRGDYIKRVYSQKGNTEE